MSFPSRQGVSSVAAVVAYCLTRGLHDVRIARTVDLGLPGTAYYQLL